MSMAARPAPSTSLPAPVSPWRRRLVKIGVALLLLAVVLWGAFTWMFYNPFEGRLGSLDRLVPPSAEVAVRGDLAGVLGAPLVKRRILARSEIADLLRAAKIDENLRAFDEGQERLNARLPGFVGGFDWRKDLFGGEIVAFGSLSSGGDEDEAVVERGVVATRLSTKARMGLSLFKHEWARRRAEEDGSLKLKRYPLLYEIDASASAPEPRWAVFWAALVRDVLIVGNDQDLVKAAAHLAVAGGGGSLSSGAAAGTSFASETPAPLRAWLDLTRWAETRSAAKQPTPGDWAAALEGLPGLAGMLLDPDLLATAQAVLRFPGAESAEIEVTGVRGPGALTGLPEALSEARTRSGAEALKEAAALAPWGTAVAAVRIEARPGALLQGAYARQEASVREEWEKMLQESSTSMEAIGREVDDYLEPGASLVVERLPECDAIALDRFGAGPNGEFVLPLPGVLVALRQRGSAGEGGAEKWIRKSIEKFRDRFESYEDLEDLPAGVRGFRFRPKFLTGEKELIRPAAAFEGDLVLLSTNEGTLRRALEARAGKKADGTPRPCLADHAAFESDAAACGEGQGFAFVEWGAALKMLRDGRREWATQAVEKDWALERRKTFGDVADDYAKNQQVVVQKEFEAEVDRRMEEKVRFQREVDFPRRVEDYVRGLRALEDLRSISAGLDWQTSGVRLGLVLRTDE